MPQDHTQGSRTTATAPLRIGALARRTRLNVETIRYYERIGLLAPPPRTGGGFRQYGPEDVRRLIFIRRARALGFSLDAIRDLVALANDPTRSCDDVDVIARVHLADVSEKIAHLTALHVELSRLVEHCRGGRIESCGIVDALNEGPAAE